MKKVVLAICIVVAVLVVVPLVARIMKESQRPTPAAGSDVSIAGDPLRAALKRTVSADVDLSPGGGRLTVQYAVMAVCEAAGIRYQWDKSQQLAANACKRYTDPLHVQGVTAEMALAGILSPIGVKYDVDENGLYLHQ